MATGRRSSATLTFKDSLTRAQKIVLVDIALNAWASGDTKNEMEAFLEDNPWVIDYSEFVEWLADNAADTMVDGIDESWRQFKLTEGYEPDDYEPNDAGVHTCGVGGCRRKNVGGSTYCKAHSLKG